MDIDPNVKTLLEGILFIGEVSSQNPAAGTVKVTRPDKDGKVTGELSVLQRGSRNTKDYWIPNVGDQVLCLQLPNFAGKGIGDGFVLGTFYSTVDTPVESDADTVSTHWKDGSYIRYQSGNIEIHAAGDVTITSGRHINLN